MDVTVRMKNGTVKEFKERGRAGGSWSQSLKYEGGFAIIIDEWGDQTAIPSEDIDEIKTSGNRRGGW